MHRENQKQKINHKYEIVVIEIETDKIVSFVCNTGSEAVRGVEFAITKLKEKERENERMENLPTK